MPQPLLHELYGKLQPAIGAPIDAPGGIEVPEGMEAGVLGLFVFPGHASGYLSREEPAIENILVVLDITDAVREYEIKATLGTLQLPASQRIRDDRRQGNGTLTGFG